MKSKFFLIFDVICIKLQHVSSICDFHVIVSIARGGIAFDVSNVMFEVETLWCKIDMDRYYGEYDSLRVS